MFQLGFYLQRLARAPLVIKAYPVADHMVGWLQGFEAMLMHSVLF
jgi:hypothetical protein